MKELEQKTKEDIEIIQQQQIKKQLKHIGSIQPHSGHTCFEYNTKTGELIPAKFKEEAVNFEDAAKGIVSMKRKIIIKEDCIYVTALNKKNAIKKLQSK